MGVMLSNQRRPDRVDRRWNCDDWQMVCRQQSADRHHRFRSRGRVQPIFLPFPCFRTTCRGYWLPCDDIVTIISRKSNDIQIIRIWNTKMCQRYYIAIMVFSTSPRPLALNADVCSSPLKVRYVSLLNALAGEAIRYSQTKSNVGCQSPKWQNRQRI